MVFAVSAVLALNSASESHESQKGRNPHAAKDVTWFHD